MAFSVYRLVVGPFLGHHFNWFTAAISGTVLYAAAVGFAKISGFGRRLMGVREFVPEAGFDFVLLRSFEDDRIACRPAYPFSILNAIIHGLAGRTLSDCVVATLRKHGQVLALGNPNEIVGSNDAARPYFPMTTEDWKAYVRDALHTAKMIVVVPGTSEGLAWEMAEIHALGALDKTLFILPAEAEKKPRKRSREQRVTALASATGVALSEADLAGDEMAVVQAARGLTPRVNAPKINEFRRLRDVRAFLTSAFDKKLAELTSESSPPTNAMPAATGQDKSVG